MYILLLGAPGVGKGKQAALLKDEFNVRILSTGNLLREKAKKDDDFARKDMPRTIAKPPFYAVEVAPAVHHTMGGLTINTETEVLTSDAKPIPGLFAAGEVTGGVHGANRLGGNAMADIAVFGKIAGAKAAAYIKGN